MMKKSRKNRLAVARKIIADVNREMQKSRLTESVPQRRDTSGCTSRQGTFCSFCESVNSGLRHGARLRRRSLRIDSIVQNHIEQRLMNLDAALVCNKAEFAKAIHEEADALQRSADHLLPGIPA